MMDTNGSGGFLLIGLFVVIALIVMIAGVWFSFAHFGALVGTVALVLVAALLVIGLKALF